MFRKLAAAVAALIITLGVLSGCSVPALGGKVDYGYVEGYYSSLVYEVADDDQRITERFYFLCNEDAKDIPVGKKDVFFDPETGEVTKYVITIGVNVNEKVVTYSTGDDGSTFYTEMYFNENGSLITRGMWDNTYIVDGVTVRETGEEEYYAGTSVVKTYRQEVYRNGELESRTVREYAEDGKMTSETIE